MQKSLIYVNDENILLGRLDILLESDTEFIIIDIKACKEEKPDLKYVLQVLIYSCMYMLESNKIFKEIAIYSVLYGKIFRWDININLDIAKQFLDMLIL